MLFATSAFVKSSNLPGGVYFPFKRYNFVELLCFDPSLEWKLPFSFFDMDEALRIPLSQHAALDLVPTALK